MSLLRNLDLLDFEGRGVKADRAARRARAGQKAEWDKLEGFLPTTDQLHMEDASQFMLPQSQVAGAQADPMAIEAQRNALRSLQDVYTSGGMTAADRAQMEAGRRNASQYEQGQRQAVQQQMAARGMGGSGAELAGVLTAQQGGANRAADVNAQVQAQAQSRALQAMQSAGGLAGQVRGQSFGEENTRRSALDAFNQANTARRYESNMRNVGTYNRGLQDTFANRTQITAGRTGMYSADAEEARKRRQAEEDRITNTASGVITALKGAP